MIQILVELADIPCGARIRKLTGSTAYLVARTIDFRDLAGNTTRVQAETGAVFLRPLDANRAISACPASKRVVWLNAGESPDLLEQMLREEGLIPEV